MYVVTSPYYDGFALFTNKEEAKEFKSKKDSSWQIFTKEEYEEAFEVTINIENTKSEGEMILNKIKQWDGLTQTVYQLRDLIQLLKVYDNINDDQISKVIDWNEIKTMPIPDDVDTSYPVWAMDINNDLLVGEDVEHIIPLIVYYSKTRR